MSGITLSASVRQNLLSLQSTTDLLSQTQERLATGNKVNSALDNPTNYFTSQSLNNRASDISNLLDGIGNGVQVLQAANTGITSLQSLVDTAKSIANQALQATSGYSTKSQVVSTAISGATASNLLGGSASNAVSLGTTNLGSIDLTGTLPGNATAAGTNNLGTIDLTGTQPGNAVVTGASNLAPVDASGGDITFDVNGSTVTLSATGGTSSDGHYSASDIVSAINNQVGTSASVNASLVGGKLNIASTGTAGASDSVTVDNFSSSDATQLGFAGASASANGTAAAPLASLTFKVNNQTVTLAGGSSYTAANIVSAINTQVGTSAHVAASLVGGKLTLDSTGTAGASDAISVGTFSSSDATQLGFAGASVSTNGTAAAPLADLTFKVNNQTVTLAGGSSYTAANIVSAINTQVGTTAHVNASLVGGKLSIASTGTAGASDTVAVNTFSSSDATQLGFASASESDSGADNAGGLAGLELKIASTAGGTASDITFGTGANQVSTLDGLNSALAANNLEASLDSTGKLTITTVNDDASETIGAISGSATSTVGSPFASAAVAGPSADTDAQNLRANLVSQYNNVITQIQTTAQDSSFNGVNLLNGDQLKLVFNETGKSTLNIQGVTDDPTGLGLSTLTGGTDFLDNASTNKVLSSLNDASNTLRSQASTLGSNLSIVQIRQDFSKNLINVLQTGASNLTLADTNEEAANSQALSTRQSIAVSALALANQSQQSVLRLLQ
ncbi:MAG TPA: flagellin [Devosia sp.]|nr:flagellin [Devosia sp.]